MNNIILVHVYNSGDYIPHNCSNRGLIKGLHSL